jgi:WD40 repeat-containing protein SMU1
MNLEVSSQDVVRLMLQFLKENNMSESMRVLQHESGVSLNTVRMIMLLQFNVFISYP